jgi:hypothetical protein
MLLALVLAALWFGAGQAAAGEPGGASQDAGQSAASGQGAGAGGGAYQAGATNSAMSIRVLSPGNNGDVTQSNTTTALGVAANGNTTNQNLSQSQTGGGHGSDNAQIAGQSATNGQSAYADATALQLAPSNSATSIRVLSPGNDGDVTQSNAATAGAIAANDNDTTQSTDQSQSGGGSGSDSTQIAGQDAANRQTADADATAVQVKPSNEALSIRVLSPGSDGDVTQSNSTKAIGAALNDNETTQSIDQSQTGGSPAYSEDRTKKDDHGKGSDSTQIAGQSASNRQYADADATAVQVKPSNEASSIRVLSPGRGGDVTQSNSTTAVAAAKNDNDTTQSIDQDQSGRGGSGDYLQVAGQGSTSSQGASADALALQLGASNTNAPVRVLSHGKDGDVTQSNSTTAVGLALNDNETTQSIEQDQTGRGHGSDDLQVAGQGAWNRQGADAGALALQLGASNENAPVRVGSPNHGHGGSVHQSNSVGAVAAALNGNATSQSLTQAQTGYGSDSLQVAGQGSWNDQHAGVLSIALQAILPKGKKKRGMIEG